MKIITLEKFKNDNRLKQVLGLFSVNLIGIPLGIITSVILTRFLGSEGYGDYKFVLSIFNFATIVCVFGFFQAGNRALVLNNDRQKAKEYYGAQLAITGALFVVMSVFLLLYALLDPNLQEKQLNNFLILVLPFGSVFLLQKYFETLFQADNQIKLLAKIRLYPQIGFLLTAGVVHFFFSNSNFDRLLLIWLFYMIAQVVVYVWVLLKLQVSFKNIKLRSREMWSFNKSFGLNLYFGSLFAVGFSQLSVLLIGYFGLDNSGVGFYSLALTFSMPLAFIPNTIATTHYRDFSSQKTISEKLIIITISLSCAALFAMWIIVDPFVDYFYGREFTDVVQLNRIVSVGILAHGLADFFNRYLGANGQGKTLRNTSFFVGATILIGNILLIPKWGEYGAAYTNILSGFIYLLLISGYYFRFIRKKAIF